VNVHGFQSEPVRAYRLATIDVTVAILGAAPRCCAALTAPGVLWQLRMPGRRDYRF